MTENHYMTWAREALASFDGMDPSLASQIDSVSLVYYDAEGWAATHAEDPAGRNEHKRASDWLAGELRRRGIRVHFALIGLERYRRWLDGRQDEPALRTEYAAQTGWQLGIHMGPADIGWAAVDYVAADDTPKGRIDAESVRAWRRAQGLSQREAADAFGMNVRTIQRIEDGDQLPPASLCIAMIEDLSE